jgi:hypothetical protein
MIKDYEFENKKIEEIEKLIQKEEDDEGKY